MLKLDFVTLFPEMVGPALDHSMIKRAQTSGLVQFRTANPRDFTLDKHHSVDDSPYGGGPGMLLRPEPVAAAIRSLEPGNGTEIVLTDPTGQLFSQRMARELSQAHQTIFVCGHYEGIDDRIRQKFATRVVSLGDFVLTGGELPALVMADAIVRLIPGVLGDPESLNADSHSEGLLTAPQFTKPPIFEELAVPEVLMSGDHGKIAKWRRQIALRHTREFRPDLFARATLAKGDLDLL